MSNTGRSSVRRSAAQAALASPWQFLPARMFARRPESVLSIAPVRSPRQSLAPPVRDYLDSVLPNICSRVPPIGGVYGQKIKTNTSKDTFLQNREGSLQK
jgi:hypothetical protein